jgi:primosomal protein N' (replication factor Y)
LLVKAPREADLQDYLRRWAGTIPKLKADIRITVDVDPYNFL